MKAIITALKHCKIYIISVFITFFLSCLSGILMTYNGVEFALTYRDKIVASASESKITVDYKSGNNFSAALNDFASNLFYSAIPQTIAGFTIVVPYCTVAYQGWIGGIVSVDNLHRSRLCNFKSAFYYLFTLLLQIIPFSLCIGAGIKCGVDHYRLNIAISWRFWKYRIRKDSLLDVMYMYLISVPLFFIASCFEFLSSWNI